MKELLKRRMLDIIAVAAFAVMSFLYFYPADMDGRVIVGGDSTTSVGSGHESNEYRQRTGERTRWTNAIFGGMPTYQQAPSYPSTEVFSKVNDAYHLYLPNYVSYVFILLLGFYILLRAFNFKVWMASLGAVIWAFSSYFFIIIAAGHIWKVCALAFIPPTIGGMVLVYRRRYLWGFFATAFFMALQIMSNHVQMTYYFLFPMAFMALAFLVQYIREKKVMEFVKATAVLVLACLVGVCVNISNLYHTYEYSKETMRGKSELVKPNSADQTSTGLDRSYITQWSYGIDETFTLLVPNTKGGASVPLTRSEEAMKVADQQFMPLYQQMGMYWGEQPGTSGPVYVGAFVVMLFIMALFLVKGPMKWALLAATVLFTMLSWGRNLMWFTDFFLDYVPMYAKFRAVSSALVVVEFTMPLLAMMGLRELYNDIQGGTLTDKKYCFGRLSALGVFVLSFVLTAGTALLFAVAPTAFFTSFVSTNEMNMLQKGLPLEYVAPVINNLTQMRQAIFVADAWRSAIIVLAGAVLLWFTMKKKLNTTLCSVLLLALCLVDMWQVNKRYLNDDLFQYPSKIQNEYQKTAADEQILQDKALDYRVFKLTPNAFSENQTAYYHKSIGGYHPAKLRRYQELIDAYITPEMQQVYQAIVKQTGNLSAASDSVSPVLNMLNTRWFIMPTQQGDMAVPNPHAFGNAWLVDRVTYVNTANEEIAALKGMNLAHEAVADAKFQSVLGPSKTVAHDSTDVVTMTAYEPNHLTYEVNSKHGGVMVCSEIFYPEWTATVDGNPVELGRVNYVLRALQVPAGKHVVVLDFHPASISKTETVAYIALALLLLSFIAVVVMSVRKQKAKEQESKEFDA